MYHLPIEQQIQRLQHATFDDLPALLAPLEKETTGAYFDNCGTGGDGLSTFNISTTAAFVLAAGGVPVAKNGNGAITSKSGSSDVLQALGISCTPVQHVHEKIEQNNLAFLHAPSVQPLLQRVKRARLLYQAPSIFNMIGPLTNPFPLRAQYVGITNQKYLLPYAKQLRDLGRKRAIVITNETGMDEAGLVGINTFVFYDGDSFRQGSFHASDYGFQPAPLKEIFGHDPKTNAQIVQRVLSGEKGAYRDIVVLNSALGFLAYGTVASIEEGIELAQTCIDSNRAMEVYTQAKEGVVC